MPPRITSTLEQQELEQCFLWSEDLYVPLLVGYCTFCLNAPHGPAAWTILVLPQTYTH